jgi:hypothetical protein
MRFYLVDEQINCVFGPDNATKESKAFQTTVLAPERTVTATREITKLRPHDGKKGHRFETTDDESKLSPCRIRAAT